MGTGTNPPATRATGLTGLVDEFVDADYLDLCARTTARTAHLAQQVLTRVGPVGSADADRRYRTDWLRRAAARAPASPLPGGESWDTAPDAATRELLHHVAPAYPDVLDATTTGAAVLFTGAGKDLWAGYFRSTNALYRPVNAVAVHAVGRLLRASRATSVLEVGAGTGGTTADLLAGWPEPPGRRFDYTVTDTSGAILIGTRQRSRDAGPASVDLHYRILDFDSVATQGVEPGTVDVIVGVNCLHNAQDVAGAVRDLHTLLRPGGALVLAESLCAADDLVHQEFIFNVLPLHPDMPRRGSRFLSVADWRAVVASAGLVADIDVNSQGPELVMVAVVTSPDGGRDVG